MERKAHQDIKPNNILLDSNGTAYIGDLGVAKNFNNIIQSITTAAGELNWMSPEMRATFKTGISKKVNFSNLDVFSIGMVALFLIDPQTFNSPNGNSELFNQDEKILKEYLKVFEVQFSHFGNDIIQVIKAMLEFNISKRISILELVIWMVFQFFCHELLTIKNI